MSLKKYHQKRNFQKTSEPKGKVKSSQSKNLYLIQKHAASRLHYDFRLELNGTLKSWAVPKGPSLDPAVKRLAVHVEDHPVEYGSFEGIIPQGQYGGGTVMLWDTGEWQSEDSNPAQAYEKGHLKFTLKGGKLKGLWKLVRIQKDPKNWLLIKAKDKYAKASPFDITVSKTKSIISNKSMEKIAAAPAETWSSNTSQKNSAQPKEISPQLATLVDEPPAGDDWLHEIKFDGYRLLCFIKNGKVTLMTRGKKNWTHKFPTLVSALTRLKLPDVILDGEVVALDDEHHSNFQLLQNNLRDKNSDSIVYYIFDLIYQGTQDLSQKPLLERKSLLKKLIPKKKNSILQYSDHIIGNGDTIFKKSCALDLEGIISKNINSKYMQKRSSNWLKVKCHKRQEFVIGGFTSPGGQRQHFGSLLIGVYAKKEFVYCGHVGTGFKAATLKMLGTLLKNNITKSMPFQKQPPAIKNVSWVKPNIVIEVEFTEWTLDGVLRHPSFKGVRKDKSPKLIIKEVSKNVSVKTKSPKTKAKKTSIDTLPLSHPEKVLYPEAKITKVDLANYYTAIHDWILPYLAKRPLTLVRCPQGYDKPHFFQKHLDKKSVTALYPVAIKDKTKTVNYAYLKNTAGLVELVQLNVLEIHCWGSHIDYPEKPDVIIFDLDPAPDVKWNAVIDAAKLIRKKLMAIKLKSFLKTTGGKGLHIVVPIRRNYSWDKVKAFARAFADAIVEENPKDFIATMSKDKRKGKIFIDYLRNGHGATAIAPYSTRARKNAPVSVPIFWEELTAKMHSDSFTIKNLPQRLAKLKKDPWEEFYKLAQTLPK
jgi:bifunctional non-homologous end joining protein LigD